MQVLKQSSLLVLLAAAVAALLSHAHARPRPDGGDTHPVPGPGLAYGGIPYGSMSGNVAEFFRKRAVPSGPRPNYIDFAPIEQFLR